MKIKKNKKFKKIKTKTKIGYKQVKSYSYKVFSKKKFNFKENYNIDYCS